MVGQDLYTRYDWMLHTVEQEYLNGQQVDYNQGKAIGGGTILNGMVWTRGSAKDYNSWGNLNHIEGQVNQYNWRWERPNLHIATEQTVTQILLETVDQLQTAVGVESTFLEWEQTFKITACFTQYTHHSYYDMAETYSRSVLDTNDSVFTALTVHASEESLAAASDEYYTNQTGPLTAPLISTIAFPALQEFADDWVDLLNEAQQRDVNSTLPPDTPATVRQGYLAQRQYQIPLLRDPTEGAIEVLADSIGTLSVAMQRPLSRGTVRPGTSNMFDSPIVDPRYCSEPFDCILLARALLFNCALINTTTMAELQPVVQEPYFCPDDLADFDRAGADSRMLDLVRQNIATEFHPSGSTAMLPLELGGVVDTELRVYGTQNVRVVDAGVMPLVLGAHLQAAVYAMAERAADIIREDALYGQASSSSKRGVSGTTGPDQPGLVGMG
ncbi:hypothetical protein SLS53_000812 [Cytospora paraplurivora]|uniref:Glucose-methanol-choline oxidoreductase N-terminal domain-containing protein n=1 Tax=Cytospora paraplurivora TaxID=2898453 RepID=A0AAN9YKQ4_9PEZI